MMSAESKTTRGEIPGLFIFALNLGVAVLILRLLGWLPGAIQDVGMRRYATFEEASANLPRRSILVPSYFPQKFSWPPASLLAQSRPYTALVMEFSSAGGRPSLVITQAASKHFPEVGSLKVADVTEKAVFELSGRSATLEVGSCEGTSPCSRIRWDDGKLRVTIIAKTTPLELIRLARSMID